MNPNFYRLLSNFDGKAFAGVFKVTTGVTGKGHKYPIPTSKQVKIFTNKNVKNYPDYDLECKLKIHIEHTKFPFKWK